MHPDQRYITALRTADTALLEEIYANHAGTVRAWVMRNSGTADEARDLFQDALVDLYQSAADESFTLTCPLGGYLFYLCRNKWLNRLREKKRETEVRNIEAERYIPDNTLVSSLEAAETSRLRQERLDRTFAQLSETCRNLLRLLGRGLSSAEVAKQLEMTDSNTVYRRKHACAQRWRSLYDQQT